MDGREGMALSGSAPYYLHRGLGSGGGGSSGAGTSAPNAFSSPPGFRNMSNSSPSVHHNLQVQSNFRGGSGSVGSSTFNMEGSPASFPPHGFTVTVASASGDGTSFGGGGTSGNEQSVKKKRGRPRKYAPDVSGAAGSASRAGPVSLGLSPLSSPNSNSLSEKRKRGRPPGSGRKQRLASVGEWMSSSAGIAFTPHVLYVAPGEDVAAKIYAFSQQRPRALCIMSASGGVSAVTLRSPTSSVGAVTYEGRFEILCLSGSYLVSETGGARSRTGGVNVSLSSHDGLVIGGSVCGRLIASRAVQVVVCSFVYGDPKASYAKVKAESDSKGEKNSGQQVGVGDNKSLGPPNASPSQHISPGSTIGWPSSKPVDAKNPNTDIDLMRG